MAVARSVIAGWLLSLLCAVCTAQSLDAAKEAAEKVIVETVCSPPTQDNLRRLGRVAFKSAEGIKCISNLLRSISLTTVAQDPSLIAGSDLLWSLVDLAESSPPTQQQARIVFEAIEGDVDHPLRAEAWLALRALDKAEGSYKLVDGVVPYAYVPAPHLAALIPDDLTLLKSRLERMHPTLRRETAWAMAQVRREFVTRAADGPALSRVFLLTGMFALYANATTDLARTLVDTFLEDKRLYTSDQQGSAVGTDVLPPMEFTLTGSVCADGGNCQALDSTATNVTGWRRDATRGLNPDPSWSSVYIGFLNTVVNLPGTNVLANYSGSIQSNIRGGYWTEKTLGIVTKTGDGTSTVSYTLKGIAKIPRCTDTSKCSATVTLWSTSYPGDAAKGTGLAMTLDGPTGRKDLPAGLLQVDRTLGDYQVEVVLTRSASNTGGCCHEWVAQSFFVAVSKIGTPPPFAPLMPNEAGALTTPAWLDADVIADLRPFNQVAGQMVPRLGSSVGLPAVDFSSPLSQTNTAYERRYTSLWPRLIFSRLANEWGATALTTGEKNQLAALNATVTAQARQSLTGALQAELNAYAFALESLEQTPLLLVMAALVRDTDITSTINAAELQLVGRIADAAGKGNAVGDLLREAKATLDAVRASSSKVDSLLRLSAAEQLMARRARYAKERYDRLARELVQLWEK